MRSPVVLRVLFLAAFGGEVLAHGGSFSDRGGVPPGIARPSDPVPPGPPPGIPIPCDCARVDCPACSDGRLVSADALARNEVAQEITTRWTDVAAMRLTLTWRGQERRTVETHRRLEPSALFAVTAGSITQGDAVLVASLAPGRDARRRYLWARARGLDPFLALRLGPGSVDVRAFPVRQGGDTVVTLEGFALAPAERRGAPRFYRTGERVLVVRDTRAADPPRDGEWADAAERRALRFLNRAAARRRYGERVDGATEVPFVPALETALTGRGNGASGDERVLVAVPADAGLPPQVGPPPAPRPPASVPPSPPPEG